MRTIVWMSAVFSCLAVPAYSQSCVDEQFIVGGIFRVGVTRSPAYEIANVRPNGFAVLVDERGILLSARHVASAGIDYDTGLQERLVVQPVQGDDPDAWFEVSSPIFHSPDELNRSSDWALFHVRDLPDRKFVPMDLLFRPPNVDASSGVRGSFLQSGPGGSSEVVRVGNPFDVLRELPHDALGSSTLTRSCDAVGGIFVEATGYDHGQSGSPILTPECGSVVGVSSRFLLDIADPDVIITMGSYLRSLLESAQELEAGSSQAETTDSLTSSIAAIAETMSEDNLEATNQALRNFAQILDQAKLFVLEPSECAVLALAESVDHGQAIDPLQEWNLPLSQGAEFVKGYVTSGTPSAARLQTDLGAARLNWLSLVEIAHTLRQSRATQVLTNDELEVVLAALESNETLSRPLWRFLFTSRLVFDSQFEPAQPIKSVVLELASAEDLAAVEGAVFDELFASDFPGNADQAVVAGRNRLNDYSRSTPNPEDEDSIALADAKLERAIGLMLAGIQRARADGGDTQARYFTNVITDLALALNRREQYLSTTAEDERAPQRRAVMALAQLAASREFTATVAWDVGFTNYQLMEQWPNAWFLGSVEIFARCLIDTTCRRRIETIQHGGTTEVYTIQTDAARARCRNLLDLALEHEDWSVGDLIGIHDIRAWYSRLRVAEQGGHLDERLAEFIEWLRNNADGVYIVPYPCAPLISVPPTHLVDQEAPVGSSALWARLAVLPPPGAVS